MGAQIAMGVQPFNQSVQAAPAVGVQPTVPSATPSQASAIVVVTSICATIQAGAALDNVRVVLRDGATGVGAIVWSGYIGAGVTSSGNIVDNGLSIAMTPGNVATLEFLAAPAGTTFGTVSFTYYISNQIEDPRAFGRLG